MSGRSNLSYQRRRPPIPGGTSVHSSNFSLVGIEKVGKNLNKEVDKIEKSSIRGLISAAIRIKRDMEKTSPKTPIDLGNLRSSNFITSIKGVHSEGKFIGPKAGELTSRHSEVIGVASSLVQQSIKPMVIIGYSANYAVHVHENMEALHWSRPGSGPKWFELAIARNKEGIIAEIHKSIKL